MSRPVTSLICRLAAAAIVLGAIVPVPVFAQTKTPGTVEDASLEDLLQIEITTLSRRQERANDVAAAVFVITQQEIRRSGFTSVPELFRLVPGMTVAQINSNNWAISVRGFGSLLTNKLLVLVDGRSIYNRTFSGEFWNSLDLPLDDIDRIEVIRGPGGSIWGANAVNGVINIITKAAADTQGAMAQVTAGTFDGTQGGVRYGGSIGRVKYRVYSQFSERNGSLRHDRTVAADNWNSFTNGFRVDWTKGNDAVTLHGGLVTGDARPMWVKLTSPTSPAGILPLVAATHNTSLLGNWTRAVANESSFEVQAFVDDRRRDDGDVNEVEHVSDLHVQYLTRLSARHRFVVGGGYRAVSWTLDGGFAFSVNPRHNSSGVVNAFVQDDIKVSRRVHLTLGSKVEHDTAYGWNVQPTARAIVNVGPSDGRLWASVSRAVRTPSASDLGAKIRFAAFPGESGLPIVLAMIGSPDYRSEHLVSVESGYRTPIGSRLAVDVSLFRGAYRHLTTNEPLPPTLEVTPGPPHLIVATEFQNLLDAESRGLELSAQWRPFDRWHIDGSYSQFDLTPHPSVRSRDEAAASYDGNAPGAQWQIRTNARLSSGLELAGGVFHVGRLEQLGVSAYTRADVRATVNLTTKLAFVATGQNLLKQAHAEWAGRGQVAPTLIPRSGNLQLVVRF